MYSQNNEESFILDFFKDFKGKLLDIGANDGQTFSNSLALIERGWEAVLVEPSKSTFEKLKALHSGNEKVICLPCAVGGIDCTATFHESGPHLKDRSDYSLLSTIKQSEKDRWSGVEFKESEVDVFSFHSLCLMSGRKGNDFDFITIDAEGMDFVILEQIDLSKTKLLCVEWNSDSQTRYQILNYTNQFGMNKVIYQTGENLLIAR